MNPAIQIQYQPSRLWKVFRLHIPFVLLFSAAISMVSYLCFRNPNIGGDAIRYLFPIHNLLAGKGYTCMGDYEVLFSPGMGLTAMIPYLFLRDIEFSGMAVSALFYLATVVLVYVYTSRLISRRASLLFTSIIVFNPVLLSLSYVNLADAEFVFFVLLVFFELISIFMSTGIRVKRLVMLGCVLGFATLVRPDGLFLFVSSLAVVAVKAFVQARANDQPKHSAIAKYIAILMSCFVIIVLPYVVFLYVHTGQITVSMKYAMAFAGGGGGGGTRPDFTLDITLLQVLKERINDVPNWFVSLRRNAVGTVSSFIVCSGFLFLPLLAVWLLYPFVASQRIQAVNREIGFLRLWIVMPIFLCWPIILNLSYVPVDRILAPYWILVHIAGAALLYTFLNGMRCIQSDGKWWFTYACVLVALLASEFVPIPASLRPQGLITAVRHRHGHVGLRTAGLWMNNNILNPEKIAFLSRRPEILQYYLLGKKEPIKGHFSMDKQWSPEDTIKFMHSNRIDYLVLDYLYIKSMPGLLQLWNRPESAKIFGLIELYSDPNSYCRIYRVPKEN